MKKLAWVLFCGCLVFWCGCSDNNASTAPGAGTGSTTVKALANNLREVTVGSSVVLGSDSGDIDEAPEHSVSLSAFSMESFEVTNGEFAEVVNWVFASPDSSEQDTQIVYIDSTVSGDSVVTTSAICEIFRADSIVISGDTVYHAGLPLVLLDRDYLAPDTVYAKNGSSDWFIDTIDTDSIRLIEKRKYITALTITPVNAYINYPVTQISWYGARFFCDAKSQMSGLPNDSAQYRLPTEAEWEAAARAGRSYAASLYPTGTTISLQTANYRQLNDRSLKAVNAYPPNPDSIYNLAGNVWEWCADFYSASFYATPAANAHDPENTTAAPAMAVRGGSYMDDARELRSSNRDFLEPYRLEPFMGFRVVRTR